MLCRCPQGKIPARWSVSSKKMDTPSPKMTSDLCKPLSAILTDSSSVSMLDYFIQFMESESAIHIVQFWLTVEAFKSAPSSSASVPLLPSEGVNAISFGRSTQSCEHQSQVKSQRGVTTTSQDCPTTSNSRDEEVCVHPDGSHDVSHDLRHPNVASSGVVSHDLQHPNVASSGDVSHDPRHSSSNHPTCLTNENGTRFVSRSQLISSSHCSGPVTDTGSKFNTNLYCDSKGGCSSEEKTLIVDCESDRFKLHQSQDVSTTVALSKQGSLCKFNSTLVSVV